MKTKLIILLTILLALSSHAATYSAIYVMGDSWSDTGNNPGPAFKLFWNNRHSNGPMWPEYLSTLSALPYSQANNQAFSGATTFTGTTSPGLQDQINALPPILPKALCVVWIGGNDLRTVITVGGVTDPTVWAYYGNNAIANIQSGLNSLYSLGARTVLVPNVPNYALLPLYIQSQPANLAFITTQIQNYNSNLANMLSLERGAHRDMIIISVDVFTKLDQVVGNAANYDIPFPSGEGYLDPTFQWTYYTARDWWIGENYAFWDTGHPTSKIHRMFSQWFKQARP